MKRTVYFLLSVMLVMSISGCKKDKEKPKTRYELLTQHAWIATAATVDPAIGITDENGNLVGKTNDLWSQEPYCMKDNYVEYFTDGVVNWNAGKVKCDGSEIQIIYADWAFNADGTVITESANNETMDYQVLQLDENTYVYSYVQNINGVDYTFQFTNVPYVESK